LNNQEDHARMRPRSIGRSSASLRILAISAEIRLQIYKE
jgi:hypothetical protein